MRKRIITLLLALLTAAGLAASVSAASGAPARRTAAGLTCGQFMAETPASAQQAAHMRTPSAASLAGRTCSDTFMGRRVSIPLTLGGAVLYSDPTFCSKELPGVQCLNGRGAGDKIGTHVQLWSRVRSFAAEDGNFFVMYRYTWVRYGGNSGSSPQQWAGHKKWRQEYNGWAVVNIEKVACTSRSCHNSGNCISSIGSQTKRDSTGIKFYFPIMLDRCSSSSATDTYHTMAVWLRTNPDGYRIQPVTLSRNVKVLQHYSCIFYFPRQKNCEPGDGIIMAQQRTPHWEHWRFP